MNLNKVLIKDMHKLYCGNIEQVWKVNEDIRAYHKELFIVLMLNIKNKIIKREIVSIGTTTECMVHPREVFREAIKNNAVRIIIAHTHPSGSTEPSDEDITITKQLVEAGKIIDIPILDHVILTKDGYNSIIEV